MLDVLGRRCVLCRRGCLGLLLASSSDRDVVLGVCDDELAHALEAAVALKVDPVARASRLELDRGEALYLEGKAGGQVVGRCVHLGNDELVLDRRELLSQLVVDGRQLLAVTAPWRVELNKDVLGLVEDNLVELVGNENSDGAVLSRNRLRLDRGLQLAGGVVSDELLDGCAVVGSEVVQGVLGVGRDDLNGERWPLLAGEVESLGVVDKLDGVDPDELDRLAVLGGNLLDGLKVLLLVGSLRLGEVVGQGKAGISIRDKVLGSDLVDEGDGLCLDEALNVLGVANLAIVDDLVLVIEGAVQDNGGNLDALSLCGLGIGDVAKDEGVALLVSESGEVLEVGRVLLEEANENNLVLGLEFGELSGGDR